MSIPAQVAETVQSAHIKQDPSPDHDLNPSTAASAKEPVHLSDIDYSIDDDEDDIPVSVLKPRHRVRGFRPMPDLRFEQSYLNSIRKADTWGEVMWITMRDQVLMPFGQGILYNLLLSGWQHWNRHAQYGGNSVGARLRRWWYGVNSWKLPSGVNDRQSPRYMKGMR